MKKIGLKGKKIAVVALASVFLSASISSLAEEMESRKLSIMQVNGEAAYITKGTNRELKAIKGMNLGQGNQVGTRENSTIYIEADDDKIIRLDEKTLVDISKASAKSLKLTLRSGSIFFNVDKPLEADEEMVFEAAHTSMSIRGTSGLFSFDPLNMEFYLIEGSVSWDLGDGQVVEIKAGERITLERDLSTIHLGPGEEAKYRLKIKVPFQWTDLDDDGLEAVMENRTLIDLTAIGLDTPEEMQQAIDKVDAYKKAQEAAKQSTRVYDDDDDYDDDDYDDKSTSSPSIGDDSSSTGSSTASDSNAGESGSNDIGTGSDNTENDTDDTTTSEYYTSRTDGSSINTYDENNTYYYYQPGENGTYVGMEQVEGEWNWLWVAYSHNTTDDSGTVGNGHWDYDESTGSSTWVWNEGEPSTDDCVYLPVSTVEALTGTP